MIITEDLTPCGSINVLGFPYRFIFAKVAIPIQRKIHITESINPVLLSRAPHSSNHMIPHKKGKSNRHTRNYPIVVTSPTF